MDMLTSYFFSDPGAPVPFTPLTYNLILTPSVITNQEMAQMLINATLTPKLSKSPRWRKRPFNWAIAGISSFIL